MRAAVVAALLLAAGLAGGCNTTVGNYFANRARDLGECVRLEVGVGLGIGASAQLAGLAHLGLSAGAISRGAGWDYGTPVWGATTSMATPSRPQAPVAWIELDHTFHAAFDHRGDHRCWGLLPALLSDVSDRPVPSALRTWLWAEETGAYARWARVHAFDVGVSAYLGFVGARVGFSPGELLDFLLAVQR